ncbi:MAG TPA: hypothetical protein VF317_02225 [Dermatophilaceae bacterium]
MNSTTSSGVSAKVPHTSRVRARNGGMAALRVIMASVQVCIRW